MATTALAHPPLPTSLSQPCAIIRLLRSGYGGSRWSPPPMDTYNARYISKGGLQGSWVKILSDGGGDGLMEGRPDRQTEYFGRVDRGGALTRHGAGGPRPEYEWREIATHQFLNYDPKA
ncbi:hypothetical protein EVAR_40202_1 [Eumeta japonica]|uniref:Uncharacterized protein n=1 Tax=Eumeta variegata TaxID=151549 RepID=A0A4C1XJK6_EUMVA|nr:hypothetical protein EVAR_40202_1 [Eumeta japonica]